MNKEIIANKTEWKEYYLEYYCWVKIITLNRMIIFAWNWWINDYVLYWISWSILDNMTEKDLGYFENKMNNFRKKDKKFYMKMLEYFIKNN